MAKNKIVSAMNQTVLGFIALKPDMAPEMKDKITETSKAVANEIAKSCQEGLEVVNRVIFENLQIPDNVVLIEDIFYNHSITAAEEKVLEDECENLINAVQAVKLWDCFAEFKSNYFLFKNALFINALSEEKESYEKLEECLVKEDLGMQLVEQNLYNVLDASPTQKIFKDVLELTDGPNHY